MAVFVAIPVIATRIDKKRGAQFPEGSRAHRTIRGMLRFAYAMNMLRVTGPMMWTLMTNLGRARSMIFLYLTIVGLILVSAGDRLAQSDRLSFNGYDFIGPTRAHAVAPNFYENLREEGQSYSRVPSIQADIIREPYVKLFIPYTPRRDNPAIARIHAVTLDGASRPDLEFAFYEHPTTGVKGVVTYIAVDSLAHGRHVLGVVPTPPTELPTDSVARAAEGWKKPLLIPFWR